MKKLENCIDSFCRDMLPLVKQLILEEVTKSLSPKLVKRKIPLTHRKWLKAEEIAILEKRILASYPLTIQQLSRELGVSKKHVQYLDTQLRERFELSVT